MPHFQIFLKEPKYDREEQPVSCSNKEQGKFGTNVVGHRFLPIYVYIYPVLSKIHFQTDLCYTQVQHINLLSQPTTTLLVTKEILFALLLQMN